MLTTFRSYGNIVPHRQGELIKSIGAERQEENKIDQIIEMVQGLNAVQRKAKAEGKDNRFEGVE